MVSWLPLNFAETEKGVREKGEEYADGAELIISMHRLSCSSSSSRCSSSSTSSSSSSSSTNQKFEEE